MKRIFLTILAVMLCLSAFSGCNQKPKGTPNDEISYGTFIVLEVSESNILVAEIGSDGTAIDTKQYSVPNWFNPSTDIKVDDKITIYHNGEVLETYPMQFAEIQKMQYDDKETGRSVVVIAD